MSVGSNEHYKVSDRRMSSTLLEKLQISVYLKVPSASSAFIMTAQLGLGRCLLCWFKGAALPLQPGAFPATGRHSLKWSGLHQPTFSFPEQTCSIWSQCIDHFCRCWALLAFFTEATHKCAYYSSVYEVLPCLVELLSEKTEYGKQKVIVKELCIMKKMSHSLESTHASC